MLLYTRVWYTMLLPGHLDVMLYECEGLLDAPGVPRLVDHRLTHQGLRRTRPVGDRPSIAAILTIRLRHGVIS